MRTLTSSSSPPRPALTKLVATIGPASEQLPMLTQVVAAGMRIMRINFSHATYEEADLRVRNIKLAPGLSMTHRGTNSNLRAVMLDTQGPEIRTGSFSGGLKEVELKAGAKIKLTTDKAAQNAQTIDQIWISYDRIHENATNGARILLDDGAIEVVVEKSDGQKTLFCKVVNSGTLGNKKGVNMPGSNVLLPAISDKDKADLTWGVKNDVDFIAASFIRKASDVDAIRDFLRPLCKEVHGEGYPLPKIISKIESTEGMANFQSILKVSDAIMVARGDLGVEIPMQTLCNVQKDIVRQCNQVGKPVIVATQMLESMQKNPRPTRAECTDVANAVFDGADCVMLSGESAKGKYPVEAVTMMTNICLEAEGALDVNDVSMEALIDGSPLDATAHAIAETTFALEGVTAVLVLANSIELPAAIAKFRPTVPIIAFVVDAKVGRFLQIHRGVHPVLATQDMFDEDADPLTVAVEHAMILKFVKPGDKILLVNPTGGNDRISTGISSRIVTVL